MSTSESVYRGRFAPSPTGPLHMGSLVAALASYLDAKHHGGIWLVRMEDLDPPREQPGAAHDIVATLQGHGLVSDEAVVYQNHRGALYESALRQLLAAGNAFPCQCSRQQLVGQKHHAMCAVQDDLPSALRVRVPRGTQIKLDDAVQGTRAWDLYTEAGDFVVRRKDGLYAYQLAVVVDDAVQGVTRIVRGIDLLDSTPRQVFLQRLLGLPTPRYLHVPILLNQAQQKLSKQTHAPALQQDCATENLREALSYLAQVPPPAAANSPDAILDWAIRHWCDAAVPRQAGLQTTAP